MRVEEEEADADSFEAEAGDREHTLVSALLVLSALVTIDSRAVRGETRRDSSDAEAAACSLSSGLSSSAARSLLLARSHQTSPS